MPVGYDNTTLYTIALTWSIANPANLVQPGFGELGSVDYLRNLKFLRKGHWPEIYNFTLAWGKRSDLKKIILYRLMGEVGNADNGFMSMHELVSYTKDTYERQIGSRRSRLHQSPLPHILDELSSPQIPIILERHDRVRCLIHINN